MWKKLMMCLSLFLLLDGCTLPAQLPAEMEKTPEAAGAITSTANPAPAAQTIQTTAAPQPCQPIVFSASDGIQFDIYTICPDDSSLTRLEATPQDDMQPVWSPDGKQIAFASLTGHSSQVFIMPAEGGDPLQVTSGEWSHSSPIWLPDGSQLACLSTDGRGLFKWIAIKTDGTDARQLTAERYTFFDAWAWSPDGTRIATVSYEEQLQRNDGAGEIHVRAADETGDQRLTDNVWRDLLPTWSPDSRRIAFLSDRDGKPRMYAIYVMQADGSNQRRVTENNLDPTTLSWSPDGSHIAFDGFYESHTSGIHILDLTNGAIQTLITDGELSSISGPDWSP